MRQEVLQLIAEWVEQENNATREAFCMYCNKYRPIEQSGEGDEVCCEVCGSVIDSLATPF